MADASTPLMRQYAAAKQQAPNALLLFRLGDFYELFYEDAVTAARELEITLTSRNKEKAQAVPMCGVPYHSAEGYIARLIQKGYRVALCEQMEEAGPGKKLVRREITRILSPGTATGTTLLRSHENTYLACVAHMAGRAGIAHADISTGEFRVTEVDQPQAAAVLENLRPREILTPHEAPLLNPADGVSTPVDDWVFQFDYADRVLRDHFGLLTLDGCGLANRPAAVCAAGALLHYVRETQKSALEHLDRPSYYDRSETMTLDAVTVRNLELLEPVFAGSGATLIGILDQTSTGMGGRLLRQRLLRPSLQVEAIEQRLNQVECLLKQTILRAEIRTGLSGILDIERLLAKVTLSTAGPRDLQALARSLERIPALRTAAQRAGLAQMEAALDGVPEACNAILDALSDSPPASINEPGTIRAGHNAELDELRDLSQNGRQFIARIESRERERTGIQSLKIRFNHVFGFYIEISNANRHLAPTNYERKQTLANAERFTTPELKDYERKVLEADGKILALERQLFDELCRTAAHHASRIKATACVVAELDVTATLALIAAENQYARPAFSPAGEMRIAGGRHPVIEKISDERFTPNDLYLNQSSDLIALITGPNMGGKSTYLRQTALIAILAQMGSFVPAASALLPITDRIFTRIGASDNLSRGRSTFMVEMTETAVILNTATENSLIILDEIGRGTATYDGLSLAWAVVEFIHMSTRARTLFATHYHELTALADELEGVRNLQVSVKEAGDRILFLRRVEPGKANRSYGIEVARLAGLPLAVIERARQVLRVHEHKEHAVTEDLSPRERPLQIRLFEPETSQIVEQIRNVDVDEMRPIEALQFLSKLQKELR